MCLNAFLISFLSNFLELRDIILIFRQLNTTNNGLLTQDEFLNIYDATTLKWRNKNPIDPWFSAAWPPLRTFCRGSRNLVSWKYFEHFVCKYEIVCSTINDLSWLLDADSLSGCIHKCFITHKLLEIFIFKETMFARCFPCHLSLQIDNYLIQSILFFKNCWK